MVVGSMAGHEGTGGQGGLALRAEEGLSRSSGRSRKQLNRKGRQKGFPGRKWGLRWDNSSVDVRENVCCSGTLASHGELLISPDSRAAELSALSSPTLVCCLSHPVA